MSRRGRVTKAVLDLSSAAPLHTRTLVRLIGVLGRSEDRGYVTNVNAFTCTVHVLIYMLIMARGPALGGPATYRFLQNNM